MRSKDTSEETLAPIDAPKNSDTSPNLNVGKLMRRMKITRSNMFNYAKRYERKAQVRSLTTNFFSLLTILVGVYLLAFSRELTPHSAQFIGVFSIGVSLISIFISLEMPIVELSKKAVNAHKCAREISEIYRSLEVDLISLKDASNKYENTLSAYDGNHDKCDLLKTRWEYRLDMPDEAKGANILTGVIWTTFSSYSPALIGLVGFVIVMALCIIMPTMNKVIASLLT